MSYLIAQYPSLLGGVSQQAEHNRLPGQAQIQTNATNFPSEGLGKRPPTEFMGLVEDNGTGNFQTVVDGYRPHVAYLDYNATERFMLTLNRGASPTYAISAKVNSYDGKAYPVTVTANAASYLNGVADTANDIKSLTVQNTTFLVNTKKNVAMTAATSPSLAKRAMLFLRQGAYKATYAAKFVIWNGTANVTFTATVKTWSGTGAALGGELSTIKTNEILGSGASANSMVAQIIASGGPGTTSNLNIVVNTGSTVPPIPTNCIQIIKDWEQSVAVIVAHGSYQITELTCTDSIGDVGIIGLYKTTARVSNLPVIADDGFKIKISEGTGETEDDFWVEFKKDSTVAATNHYLQTGQWYETIAPSTTTTLDATTMPCRMLPTRVNGVIQSFTIDTIPWVDRKIGDTETNPNPSFVGQPITDITFYRDRLMIAAGYSVVASESSEYFNFFRTTIRSYPDSDIVDVDVSHNKDFTIRWLVPFEDSLFIFSDKVIFRMVADPIFSIQYVSVSPTFEYNVYRYCKPVIAGRVAIFATDNGGYLHFYEMYRTGDQTFDVTQITASVPSYIPKTPTILAINTSLEMLAAINGGDAYVYKYRWQNNEKVQGSWSKWTSTESDWRSGGFFDNYLYLVVAHGGAASTNYTNSVERITLGDSIVEQGFPYNIHLDRRVNPGQVITSYNAGLDQTTISIPAYSFPGSASGIKVFGYKSNTLGCEELPVVSTSRMTTGLTAPPPPNGGAYISPTPVGSSGGGTIIVVSGNTSGYTSFKIGFTYQFLHQFGEIQIMEPSRVSNSVKPIMSGRVQLRYANVHVNNARSFEVQLQATNTETNPLTDFDFAYPSAIDQNNGIATNGTYTGNVRVAIFKHNQKARVSLINESIYPAFFTGVEWELFLNVRGGRYPM